MSAILLCALAAAPPEPGGQAPTEPEIETPVEVSGWHFAAIPLASYGSDIGLSLGAQLFLYKRIPEHPGERDSAALGFSYATRGPKSVDLGWEFRRLFDTSLRTHWNVHAADDDRMPYWGEGAQLGGLSVPAGFGTPPEPYRYRDRRIFVSPILRGAFVGPFGWHVRARYLNVNVSEPSALLTASNPPGARGGRVALGEVGLLYDTRDRELDTHSGIFVTAAAFAAPQIGGVSDFAFHGYDASARIYVPLWFGATLALRGLYDTKIAGIPYVHDQTDAVPFFERTLYEGIGYNEGLGGAADIRGVARYRIAGNEKMLGNVQLRMTLLTTHWAAKTQEYGVDVGVDAGRARQPGYPAVEAASVAAGLRFIWDRAILLRIEVGRTRGGENDLYVSFGEMF